MPVFAVALALVAGTAPAAYPERPPTLLVPWAAGGGTDATARIIATLLEKELGHPVNVVNRVGGGGVVRAPGDRHGGGRRLLDRPGVTDRKYTAYTPLALMNADPAGLQVRAA